MFSLGKSQLATAMVFALSVSACGGGSSNDTSDDVGVVSPPVVPETPPTGSVSGLDQLLGVLQLDYNFYQSTTGFRVTTQFDSGDYTVVDGTQLLSVSDSTRAMACTHEQTSDAFLCALARSTNGGQSVTSMNLFFFQLLNGSGNGLFEFCIDDELESGVCANQLVNSPDGPVSASVFASKTEAGSTLVTSLNGQPVDPYQEEVFHRSDELEFGGQPGTRAGLNLPEHNELVIDTVKSALTR